MISPYDGKVSESIEPNELIFLTTNDQKGPRTGTS